MAAIFLSLVLSTGAFPVVDDDVVDDVVGAGEGGDGEGGEGDGVGEGEGEGVEGEGDGVGEGFWQPHSICLEL